MDNKLYIWEYKLLNIVFLQTRVEPWYMNKDNYPKLIRPFIRRRLLRPYVPIKW